MWLPLIPLFVAALWVVKGQNFDGSQPRPQQQWFIVTNENPQALQQVLPFQPQQQQLQFPLEQPQFVFIEAQPQPQFQQPQPQFQQPQPQFQQPQPQFQQPQPQFQQPQPQFQQPQPQFQQPQSQFQQPQPQFQQPQPQFQQPQPWFQQSQPSFQQPQPQQPESVQQVRLQQQPFQQPTSLLIASHLQQLRIAPAPTNRFIPQPQAPTRQRASEETFVNQLMRRDLPIMSTQEKPSEGSFRTTRRPTLQTPSTSKRISRVRQIRIQRPRPSAPPPPPQFLPPESIRNMLKTISIRIRTQVTPRPETRVETIPMRITDVPPTTTQRRSRKTTTTLAPAATEGTNSSHLFVDANDVFLECCKEHKVDSACESRCNFDVLNKKVLTAMFLGSDPCPRSNGRDLLTCAAQEMDHTECCRARGIASTSAGEKCLGFCQMSPGSQFQADVSMLPCWAVLKDIKQCFKDALIANNI